MKDLLGGLRARFYTENAWIFDYCGAGIDDFDPRVSDIRTIPLRRWRDWLRRFFEAPLGTKLGDTLEHWVRSYQKKRIENDPRTYEEGGRVVADDMHLEFHPRSKEKEVLEKYNEKLRQIKLNQFAHETDSGLKKV